MLMLWGIADFHPTWPLNPAPHGLPFRVSYSGPRAFFMAVDASKVAIMLTSTSQRPGLVYSWRYWWARLPHLQLSLMSSTSSSDFCSLMSHMYCSSFTSSASLSRSLRGVPA